VDPYNDGTPARIPSDEAECRELALHASGGSAKQTAIGGAVGGLLGAAAGAAIGGAGRLHRLGLGRQLPAAYPQRLEASQVASMLAERDRRIEALEAEVERLSRNQEAKPPAG
jgi:hypothetical protein